MNLILFNEDLSKKENIKAAYKQYRIEKKSAKKLYDKWKEWYDKKGYKISNEKKKMLKRKTNYIRGDK